MENLTPGYPLPKTNTQEKWKNVIDFEEFYQISNIGRFKIKERIVSKNKIGQRLVPEKITTGTVTGEIGNQYKCVSMSKNGIEKKQKTSYISCHSFCS